MNGAQARQTHSVASLAWSRPIARDGHEAIHLRGFALGFTRVRACARCAMYEYSNVWHYIYIYISLFGGWIPDVLGIITVPFEVISL